MNKIKQGYTNFIEVPHTCPHCGVGQLHNVPTVCVIDSPIVAVEYPLECHACGCVKHYSVAVKKP